MTNKQIIILLKGMMVFGVFLFFLGHYLLLYADLPASMGVKGIIICAACIAFGLLLSLPTKIYLTFLLVNLENERTFKRYNDKLDK